MENPTRTAAYLALLEARRQELSAQLERILPRTAVRVVAEFGCGHGHFLTAYAQCYPGKLCLGLDIAAERIARANRKRDRARLPNLHFLHAEARLLLETLPADTLFSEIYLLFPDPWPKQRHHKHRLLQPDFLARVALRARASTRLYFRTDHDLYFEEALRTLGDSPDWRVVDEPWPFEHLTVFQSRAPTYRSLIAKPRPPPPS